MQTTKLSNRSYAETHKRTIEGTHMIQNLIVSRINFDMLDRSELIVGDEISPICHLSQQPTHKMKNLDHRRVCPTDEKKKWLTKNCIIPGKALSS